MPTFSKTSADRLGTCDPPIQKVMNEVVRRFDCTVMCGFRSEFDQTAAVKAGNSKTPWPKSAHNSYPSRAVDVAPFMAWGPDREKIVWPDPKSKTFTKDLAVWYLFGGMVLGIAEGMGIKLRWGGDWDGDRQINDQSFDDLPHFELAE